MAHDHTHEEGHDHGHHGHGHAIGKILPEKNYKLYRKVSHVSLLLAIVSFVIMWVADSHVAFGDWLHAAVADVGTIYFMSHLAHKCYKGEITAARFNQLVSLLNTFLLFAAAAGVLVELQIAERHNSILAMTLTGIFTFYGNWKQHGMMHAAHGDEDHPATGLSGFKTIDQHFLVDMFFAGSVVVAAVWIYFQLPGFERIDKHMAWLLIAVLCMLGGRNVWHMLHGRTISVH